MVLVLSGCGSPGSEKDVLTQVDMSDPSCANSTDPILLADLFHNGSWIKAPAIALVAGEVGRESHPQARVVVGAPAAFAEPVRVRPEEQRITSKPFHISEYRFQALELVASVGSQVYVRLFDQTEDRASAKVLAWVDSVGDVHFLGGCAPFRWTEPLGRFAEDMGWQGTQEELLLALINGEPELEALYEWTFGPPEPKWADQTPDERHLFDAPRRYLEGLEPGMLVVSVPDSWRTTNTLLCTFVPDAGWNPCIPLTEWSLFESPAEIDAYHVPGESIEVWLRDADDESSRSMIGLVVFAEGQRTVNVALIDPAPAVRHANGDLLGATQEQWIITDQVP